MFTNGSPSFGYNYSDMYMLFTVWNESCRVNALYSVVFSKTTSLIYYTRNIWKYINYHLVLFNLFAYQMLLGNGFR